jgi:tRNA modification GTPase
MSLLRTEDTIVAIASPPGGGLRGIVRMSGPQALKVAAECFESQEAPLEALAHPTALRATVPLSDSRARLPGWLFVWPNSRSYTRQPTVEFHTLGSPPLLERLVRTVCSRGVRLAEPGEFTLRAFLAGRLDLTQAEAVLGVIDAHSQRELHAALRQLAGGLSKPVARLRESLLEVLAQVEAALDFAEEDIEFISRRELERELTAAAKEVSDLIDQMQTRLESGARFRIVLYGRPNAGKSSLLNALARSQRAMVSEIAGTTRDYVATPLEIEGLPCLLVDTAGREESIQQQMIDDAAQRFAREQFEESHLRLLCLDASLARDAWEERELARCDERRLIVATKCDAAAVDPLPGVATSSITGAGLTELQQAIARMLLDSSSGEVVGATAQRCRDSFDGAVESLQGAIEAVRSGSGDEIVAGEIRIALEEIGRVAGVVYTDDLLDRIFSRFCIGK